MLISKKMPVLRNLKSLWPKNGGAFKNNGVKIGHSGTELYTKCNKEGQKL